MEARRVDPSSEDVRVRVEIGPLVEVDVPHHAAQMPPTALEDIR
jgi:hypothetical protein